MASGIASPDLDRRLLVLATGLAGVRRVPELALRLRPAFEPFPDTSAGGLGILDEERGLVVHHGLLPDRPGLETQETPAREADLRRFGPLERRCLVEPLSPEAPDAFSRALLARGIGVLASAPLFFDQRYLG